MIPEIVAIKKKRRIAILTIALNVLLFIINFSGISMLRIVSGSVFRWAFGKNLVSDQLTICI
jgi:hypothetical protein